MQAAFHKPQREHHRASQLNAASEQWTERLVLTPAGKPGSDALFISLLDGFRPTGGLARAEEILMRSRFSSGPQIAELGRLTAGRRILSVHWNHLYWLPLFQFSGPGIAPPPAVGSVLAELVCVMDEWQLAEWFCRSNQRLDGNTPAAVVGLRPNAVLDAAHADRMAIVGRPWQSGNSSDIPSLEAICTKQSFGSLPSSSRA